MTNDKKCLKLMIIFLNYNLKKNNLACKIIKI